MPVSPLTTISGVDGIVNQDRVNHLNCRKGQLLAVTASRSPWSDLLLYGALGSTFAIYRHCFRRGGYRWDFPAPYVVDEDLALLGFQAPRLAKLDLADVRAGLPDFIARDQPVFFDAPRGDFGYWVDFMRRTGTVPEEYRELHSYLVGGLSADGETVLIVDNTTDNLQFQRFEIPMADLVAGYAREPQRWFLDCQTLIRTGEPDFAGFVARYRAFVESWQDGFEIYDLIADSLPSERTRFEHTYQTPSVNSLALLAGSRGMFQRFLRHTGHSPQLAHRYERLASAIALLQDQAARFHGGAADVSLDDMRRDLHALRLREQDTARLLRADLGRGPVSFPAADALAGRA
ncbi:hypothetical protein [Actinoplanes teichomyceticus]|uniref:Butirosin biosynthesis protein H-like n=1 Tax=Actinoplanes teichomyceticus TaxID=1867 RepID=A0A561VGS9_ACTTI|nr:hypothetical protein [Actinoplanes teichomyceticus]TWG10813.1 hypothetical protein FHX34_107310 [Actinoplanes teichomyceticus]GIF12566.1 hypothetical protein Ate01nite_25980 [Actinoplanes teichomyceticus]